LIARRDGMAWRQALQQHWWQPAPGAWGPVLAAFLLPLSWIYDGLRRLAARRSRPGPLPVPVVIVGNLVVGGAGKTPVVLALVQALRAAGFHPGVVSRGYQPGRRAIDPPRPVHALTPAEQCGDEPLLLHRRAQAPVWVGRRRGEAARALLAAHPEVDVLVSDDGLQHRALPRDVEVVVVDARRAFGNRQLLPAGPLREPLSRLPTVDQLWICGDGALPAGLPAAPATASPVRVALGGATHVRSLARPGDLRPLASFTGADVVAVAGIAAPQRFFAMLAAAGVDTARRPWPDHHAFTREDLAPLREHTVLMTETDAVKCVSFAAADWWVVPLDAAIPAEAVDAIESDLRRSRTVAPSDITPRRS